MAEIVPIKQRAADMRRFFEDRKSEIGMALARVGITPDRIIRAVFTSAQKNPKLYECEISSVYKAVLLAAQAGLMPDGITAQAHLIPRNDRRRGIVECNLQIGYRGYLTLCRRSGEVTAIWATVVHEKDHYKVYEGTERRIEHEPYEGNDDPGPLKAVYAVARFKDGSVDFEPLTARDIAKVKASAQGTDRSDSPWKAWEAEMWKKTAMRRLCKRLPQSEDAARLLELDAQAEAGVAQDLGDVHVPGIDEARPVEAEVKNEPPPYDDEESRRLDAEIAKGEELF